MNNAATKPQESQAQFQIREIRNEDYWLLSGWFAGRGGIMPGANLLPPTGLLVCCNDEPAAGGFLYKTNSEVCLIEWVISNPAAERWVREQAVEQLMAGLEAWGKQMGYSVVYSITINKKWASRLEANGYKAAHEASQLYKELG